MDNLAEDTSLPTYLVIGHVTRDLKPDGGFTCGGTATYSSFYAHALGARAGVLTSAGEFPLAFDRFPAIQVCCHLGENTTTFENVYEPDGRRRQYVRAVADPLHPALLPEAWQGCPIVHLGPLVQEVSYDFLDLFPDALLGVTPQGWLRQWDENGLVHPVRWACAERVLARADALVLSMEDLGGDWGELERLRRLARLLVLTDGRHGAVVYQDGMTIRVPAFHVKEVDPTGAGDVFAAALFLRLAESGDAEEAARFANSAASFLVEAPGLSRLPSKAMVEERQRNGRLRH